MALLTIPRRRRSTRRRTTTIVAAVVTASLALASCSSSEDDSDGGNGGASAASDLLPEAEGKTEYPVTIEHTKGETEIPERPERIAAVDGGGWSVELAASLGVTPVVANDPQEWVKEALPQEVETTIDPVPLENIETIANADPDLIVTGGEVDEFYDQLTDIAPVLVLDGDTELEQAWAPQVEALGEAHDLQDTAEKLKQDSEQFFVDYRDDHPNFQGMTVSYLVMFQDSRLLYSAARTETTDTFLDLLGFKRNPVDTSDWDEPFISVENVGDVDADFMILTNHGAASPEDLEEVTDNPLWKNLQAVKDGHWAEFGTTITGHIVDGEEIEGNLAYSMGWPGPLGEMWSAEQLAPILESAF